MATSSIPVFPICEVVLSEDFIHYSTVKHKCQAMLDASALSGALGVQSK